VEVLAIATKALSGQGAQARARRSVRQLVDVGVLEQAPALGRDDDDYQRTGALAEALLGVAKRSGSFSERLPPPEPERLSELLGWQHLLQRRAWSLSGRDWSAWCLGRSVPRPPRPERRTVGSGLRITGTVQVPRRPVDTIVWSAARDRTWAFASPNDRDAEVWVGQRTPNQMGLADRSLRRPLTAHYPEIDLATFDDLALLQASRQDSPG